MYIFINRSNVIFTFQVCLLFPKLNWWTLDISQNCVIIILIHKKKLPKKNLWQSDNCLVNNNLKNGLFLTPNR